MTSDRGSGLIQSERSSAHLHSSERDSGIGGITIGPVSRARGSVGNGFGVSGDMIIGNQPPLDVDAILRQQQTRSSADGSLCQSPENRKSSNRERWKFAASQRSAGHPKSSAHGHREIKKSYH